MTKELKEVNYEYNDMLYTVVASEEEHFKLENDLGYLQIFLQANLSSLEMQVKKDPQPAEGTATWTKNSVLFFLTCLSNRKQDLRNSKIKKKDIWRQIKEEMMRNGYAFDENIIERKFRKMKNTHKTIKDNKKRSATGRGEVKWEYFEAMEEIFVDDKTINIGHTISSLPSTSTMSAEKLSLSLIETVPPSSTLQNFVELIENEEQSKQNKTLETHDLSVPILTPSSPLLSPISPLSSNNKKEKALKGRQLYGLRKQQLELEESRIKELRVLREAIEENNKIQKERNELLKKFLEKQL